MLKFNNYKDCLLKNKIVLGPQQRFKSEAHNAYIEEVNKIELNNNVELNNNDDKRLLDSDGITTYPYGTSAGKVCKIELLEYFKYK